MSPGGLGPPSARRPADDPDLVLPAPPKPPKRYPRIARRLRRWAHRLDPQPWMEPDLRNGGYTIHMPAGPGSIPLARITMGDIADQRPASSR